ncbi:MAG: DUF4923 family protein [Bacteroidales bacterium]|nr:DUF4923 family protein [Candidatus Liminaster caballi]
MKKLLASVIALTAMFSQSVNAQDILSNLLSGLANTAVSATAEKTNEQTGNLLSGLLTSLVGDITTTEASITGTWSYTEPAVQFESQNLLTQAGGTLIADKVESKLSSAYKLVGIRSGKMTFTFDGKGNVTYSVGAIKRQGTYTFDKETKALIINTSAGIPVKTYVTVSGNDLCLTFDSSKFMDLVSTLGSKFKSLATVTALAGQYDGMKIGFKFSK